MFPNLFQNRDLTTRCGPKFLMQVTDQDLLPGDLALCQCDTKACLLCLIGTAYPLRHPAKHPNSG